jgi:hypothetical protein
LQSPEVILAASSAAPLAAVAHATVDSTSFDKGLSAGLVKKEKLQTVGLAVPIATVSASGAAGGPLLTAQEKKWMELLPAGIGKPFLGRSFSILGGCFDMGDLGRVIDVVAKVRLAPFIIASLAHGRVA